MIDDLIYLSMIDFSLGCDVLVDDDSDSHKRLAI